MKHAGATTLALLRDLLDAIRAEGPFREPRPGVFYLKSKAFLHFHEDQAGIFADVRAPGETEFTRIKVDDEQGRAALLDRVNRASRPDPFPS
jgi:hypothetical protein